MQYRTDLAMECISDQGVMEGVHTEQSRIHGFTRQLVQIETPSAAEALRKQQGAYITFHLNPLRELDQPSRAHLAQAVAESLSPMLPGGGDVLVVGLGNRRITSDALGTKTAESVLVTRHLKDVLPESLQNRLRGVCTFSPGVLGITGMETADLVRGAVAHVQPAAVIAIDALAAHECARIGTTIQLTDTGIQPGSGVGNHRQGLNKKTLGVPVIAIGVPLVVYTGVIIHNALSAALLPNDASMQKKTEQLIERILSEHVGEMVVTPREIDELVNGLAQIIAMSINLALQPKLSPQEISAFAGDYLQ